MTISIGRFAGVPRAVNRSGERVHISGFIRSGADDETQVGMQQFSGLLGNRDEPVVPVVCTERPDLDGFYRPVSGAIDEIRGLTKTFGRWLWQIDLERVGGGFAVAPVEVVQLAPGRTTDHTNTAVTSTNYAAFASDIDYDIESPFGASPYSSADGELRQIGALVLPDASTLYTHRYFAHPERHYWGAATMEVLRSGTWYPVVGRQIPAGVERWRLSNGIIRVSLSGTSVGDLVFEKWDGATWDVAGTMQRGIQQAGSFSQNFFFGAETFGSGASLEYMDPVVLRNDPFGVVVRVHQFAGRTETYRIQPGRWDIEIALDTASALVQAVSFGDPADALSTFSTSYGIIRTTPSDSHRWFVGCDKNVTEDTTNGYIYLNTAAQVMNICAGIAGTTATDADRSISAFLTGSTLRSQVIAR